MKEQKHPLEDRDRLILEDLAVSGMSNYNLGQVARLLIRYRNFPGARDIQAKIQQLLNQWHLTEEELYQTTRELHRQGAIYAPRSSGEDAQDWS